MMKCGPLVRLTWNEPAVVYGRARAVMYGRARAVMYGRVRAVMYGRVRSVVHGRVRAVVNVGAYIQQSHVYVLLGQIIQS